MCYRVIVISALVSVVLAFSSVALAKDYLVETPVTVSAIQNACQAAYADLATGPHNVIIPDGTYHNLGTVTINGSWDGNSSRTLTLMGATKGGVTLTGDVKINVLADRWVIRDLVFQDVPGGDHILGIGGDNIRITDNKFLSHGTGSTRGWTIRVGYATGFDFASECRIDHNLFQDSYSMGIVVYQYCYNTLIEYNLFRNFYEDCGSKKCDARSAIQVGGEEEFMDVDLETIVQYNLFYTCHGDPETISNKGSSNTYQYNTFVGSEFLALRYGQDCVVRNNWFFGLAGHDASGVRAYDGGHKISNNYFDGLTWPSGLWLISGTHDDSNRGVSNAKYPAHDVEIYHNTFVNMSTREVILFGTNATDYTFPVHDVTLSNNIFANNDSTYLIRQLGSAYVTEKSIIWGTNLFDKGKASNEWTGWTTTPPPGNHLLGDPSFVTVPGPWKDIYILPASDSIARQAGVYNSSYSTDMFGRARSDPPDLGCSNYSAEGPSWFGVTEKNVGPTWTHANGPQPPTGLSITAPQ